MGDLDIIIGIIVVGGIIGLYYYVQNLEAKHGERTADTYIKKTMADVEKARLEVQQEETKLKRDVVDFQKQKLLSGDKSASLKPDRGDTINAEYTIISGKLEDRTDKEKRKK